MGEKSTKEEVMEEWKDIVGYEGCYQVSNLGRVKSLPRIVKCGKGTRLNKEKVLKPSLNRDYEQVVLYKNSKTKTHRVHRLVASAFIPNPEGKAEINHLNGKRDNRVESLEWATHKENVDHAVKTGLSNKGEKNGVTKLTEQKAVEIINLIKNTYQSYSAIGRGYQLKHTTIHDINTGRTWGWLLPEIARPIRPIKKNK